MTSHDDFPIPYPGLVRRCCPGVGSAHVRGCINHHEATAQIGTRPDKMRRMAKPPMIKRTYYVPRALYEAAMDKADERQENLSDVIREALERYVRRQS